MQLLCVNPTQDPLWRRLIEQHPSDIFHSPDWLQVLVDTYHFETSALVVVDDAGIPQAGIPFCKIEDMMDPRLVSLPFSDYCDVLAYDADQWCLLSSELEAYCASIALRSLHNPIGMGDGRFKEVNRARWHGLDLGPDIDALWRGIALTARQKIRSAVRSGVKIRISEDRQDLRCFFQLHLGIRKNKYQLLAQPYRFFENVWEHFLEKGNGVLLLAVYEDQIISTAIFLIWKERFYYKFSASNPAYIHLRPNDLMIWEGIRYAKERGLSCMDFGLSDWDQEGLVNFKRKFGTQEKSISFRQYLPAGAPSTREKHTRQLLGRLTDLFTDPSVPDEVTEKAGNLLYQYFI